MRVAVIVAPERLEVRSVSRPRLQADDEVVVRTLASGICSGDLMPWYLARKVGTVLGHEVVGQAVEVGAAVEGIAPGDLVFMHHHAPCGVCADCLRHAPIHCSTWKHSSLDPGGMAEWIRVPGDNVRGDTFAINELHPEQGVFIEPLGCCVKAFRRSAESLTGLRVVVVGCGVMGLLNVLLARAWDASDVQAVEPDPNRRALAQQCGATRALEPEEAAGELKHAADLVIVGPGSPAVIQQALGYVRPAGTLCLFTPTATGVLTPLDLGDLYFREVRLIPSYSCGPDDTLKAYQLLLTGRIDPRPLVTHRFPLEQAQEAFDTARRGRDEAGRPAVKVLVTFSTEAQS
jgi:L-iditol 2-dehydrogenase